jgi:CzcA family heavy metal efflux pump
MLNALIRLSLRHRPLVLALTLLVLVAGWQAAREMPLDVLPELSKPVVTVLTECPALSPEEVETRVTRPIEAALLGVPGLDRLRSNSDSGLSVIFVEFAWGTDLRAARLLVQERLLTTVRLLPEGVAPGMAPSTSLMGEVLLIGISSTVEKLTPPELRTLADTTIRRRLQSIPGVADVLPMGGGVRQIHVLPDPRRLTAHQMTIEEVQDAVAHAAGNATSGILNLNSREMAIRTLGLTTELFELRRTPVKIEEDHVILLGDIARVEYGIQPPRGDASVNGRPGVILSVDKAPGVDTLRLTVEVERALDSLRTSLPAGVEFTVLFRQGDFIQSSIRNLREVVRDGVLIVAAILFLFLLRVRTTLITLTAIPVSFAISFLVFRGLGVSMNTMTLGGLAVALGMVVDDAIVDVENVFRRWRENLRRAEPRPLLEVVASASSEVRNSILYATMLVLLTFLPLAALPGLEGQLFAPVAIATCVSVSASFLVSLTVIPALCALALRARSGGKADAGATRDPFLMRGLKAFAERRVLPLALGRPFLILSLTAVALSAAIALYPTLRKSFLPPFHETSATVSLISAPGTSLYASTQLGETAVRLLQAIPEIKSIGRRTGRAERDDHVVPVSISEFDLEFHSHGRPREVVLAEIRQQLGGIPGTFVNVGAPIAHRLAHMLSGTTAKLAIKIFVPDLDQAQKIAAQIAEIARGIPGLVDVMIEPQAMIPQVVVQVDRERTLPYGVQVEALNEQVTQLVSGRVVARLPQGEQTIDLLVRLPSEWTDTPEELGAVTVRTPVGSRVALRAMAEVQEGAGPSVINRENAQRRVMVTANAIGRDWPSLIERLDAAVKEKVRLPEGAFVRLEGEYEAQRKATRRILVLSAAVLLVLAFLLYTYFQSGVLAAQVFLNIPLALLGGLLLTWALADEISIATLVGFIAVGGVAARNGILMLSHYLHLLRHEGESFTRQMVIRGTLDRLPPVLMTALSAALAMLPLVFAAEQPGKELLHPVAVVMVGGLVSSTLLDLFLTPAIFFHFGRRAAERSLRLEAPAAR